MIIFDTNAVNLLPPEGPRADIIRKLRQSGHHQVAVPWMVLEEMVAHQARFYPEKYRAVVNTLERLQEILPWDLESSLEPLALERFLDHWRNVYREIFEVIETSDTVIRRAYQREALALPPAKRVKDHSEGGRDVAIWFSVLEYLEQNPDERVYFVTNNTSDFSDGSTYPYPMNEDVQGFEDRLVFMQDFDQVVSQFTKAVSGKDAEAAAAELLGSPSVREGVAQAARNLSALTGFDGLGDGPATEQWCAWSEEPDVELLDVTDVTGHEIGDDVWYTARARWLLYGPAVDEMEGDAGNIACVWELKILFSTRDDETLTLLASGEPSVPDCRDESCMEILDSLRKRAAIAAAGARHYLRTLHTPLEGLVADQISPSLAKLDVAAGKIARDALARQTALINGPVQQLARKIVADQMKAFNGPAQQVAQQIVADRLKLINGPVQRLAQQMGANHAAWLAAFNSVGLRHAQHLASTMPKLDIAASIPTDESTVAGQLPSGNSQDEGLPPREAPVPREAHECEPIDSGADEEGTTR
ncbi:PIN domain-containing protein [Streptomyces chartreusis]|uniref:PIN domain-containing protein n=1 Tax=Streptomyces chartreusis TaxID=1969 RepID=UPI0037139442